MDASVQMVNGNERAVNDTLVMKSCTFNNLNCVIRATKKFNCVIEGCRFDTVTSIIHNDGVWYNGQTTPQSYTAGLNTNIVINGISINNVNYIFRSRSTDTNYANQSIYAFANIVINGILGEVTSAVVDFQKGGSVNLEYNAPITDKTKLCSKDSNCYFSSNVKALDNTEHKVLSTYFDHTIDLELEPDEIYAPFGDNIVNVEQVSWDVAGIEVYIEQNNFVEVTESSDTGETICGESKRITLINTINKKYKNSNFNYFGKFKMHNVSSIPLKAKMTIRTANLI